MALGLNYIDIAILVLIFLSALVGFIRGFVREALSLTTWVVAILLAIVFSEQLATQLPFISHELARLALSFVLILVGVLMIGSLINHIVGKGIHAIGMGGLDRVLGGAFGVIRGALVVTLLVLLLGLGFLGVNDYQPWQKSTLVPHFKEGAEWIKSIIPPDVEQQLKEAGKKIGISVPEEKQPSSQTQSQEQI